MKIDINSNDVSISRNKLSIKLKSLLSNTKYHVIIPEKVINVDLINVNFPNFPFELGKGEEEDLIEEIKTFAGIDITEDYLLCD